LPRYPDCSRPPAARHALHQESARSPAPCSTWRSGSCQRPGRCDPNRPRRCRPRNPPPVPGRRPRSPGPSSKCPIAKGRLLQGVQAVKDQVQDHLHSSAPTRGSRTVHMPRDQCLSCTRHMEVGRRRNSETRFPMRRTAVSTPSQRWLRHLGHTVRPRLEAIRRTDADCTSD
jgi:hypothetical protein